jgi:outer membrane protein assembly factor BamD (BamD/ComL family)
MKRSKFHTVPLAAILLLLAGGCVSTSWQTARRVNTVASYHQFLRENPNSTHAAEARERIAYLRVEARPTIEAFERFREEFPSSTLLSDLEREMAPLYFEQARSANTPEAYRDFLSHYPNSELAERARGNLVWVERVRDQASAPALRRFVAEHPESDYAPEAQGTLRLLEVSRSTNFRRIGVRVDVSQGVQDSERVARGFAAMVARSFGEVGVEVRPIPIGTLPSSDLDGWVRIDYREVPASGSFGRGSMTSDCRVRVYHRDQAEPVWDRHFQTPADHLRKTARGQDKTVFGNASYSFWRSFFVPTATWATSEARIHSIQYEEPVVDVDVQGDRAAVLFSTGGIEYLDVSSPLEPKLVQRYRRTRDLSKWSGVKLLPDQRAALYGLNGLEIVRFGGLHAERIGRWETSEVGVVREADLYGETLLVAGSRGIFAFRINHHAVQPHRLLDGDMVGITVREPYIYMTTTDDVAVADAKQLMRHMTGPRIALGPTFQAQHARLSGNSLWVFGKERIVQFSLHEPARPIPIAKLEEDDTGTITDAVSDGGHLYLLGERGLQIANPSDASVSDQIQVDADQSLAPMGRFLLLAGNTSVEVVDLSPYRSAPAAADEGAER